MSTMTPQWFKSFNPNLRARPPKPPETGEKKKIVITESRTRALRRCAIHFVPIGTSITILTLNLYGIYIGVDFSGLIRSETINLLLLQVAAKIHEIFIVASLGVIVLQVVRQELLFGDGLPLGLVGSGLSFGNFAFFFRTEFWSAVRYVACHGNKLRKAAFVAMLIVSGLTAALAGPASATLIVPKSQDWPIGGTKFFLNGSSEDFWPSDLSGSLPELRSYCTEETTTSLGICPGGGFQSLWEHWGRMNYTNFYEQDVRTYAKKLSGSTFYWPIYSPSSQLPPLYTTGNARVDNSLGVYTYLAQPHAASAAMLERIGSDWWKALITKVRQNPEKIDDRFISARLHSSITDLRCAEPRNLSTQDKTVLFPSIDGRFTFTKNLELVVDSMNTTAVNHLRYQWVHLPDQFGTASIGGVFESPWTSSNTSRVVIGCTAQSGWVPADVRTDEYSFWTGWYPWNLDFNARTPGWVQTRQGEPLPPTNGRVAFGDDWLNLLTPQTPVQGPGIHDKPFSTIESILENTGIAEISSPLNGTTLTEDWSNGDLTGHGKTPLLEAVICSILVDGLSRSGSHRLFNKTGPAPEWSLSTYTPLRDFDQRILAGQTAFAVPDIPPSKLTTLEVSMLISGIAFRKSLAGFLAMSVLLTHMLMALIHIGWVVFNKRTSNSWVSVSELIVLAQNSQPAYHTLINTGAGIRCKETFAQVAKIRVKAQPGSSDINHVELVFDESNGFINGKRESLEQPLTLLQADHTAITSQTWPRSPGRLHLPPATELHSRSSSTERLIPRVRLVDEEKGCIVRVNKAYS